MKNIKLKINYKLERQDISENEKQAKRRGSFSCDI